MSNVFVDPVAGAFMLQDMGGAMKRAVRSVTYLLTHEDREDTVWRQIIVSMAAHTLVWMDQQPQYSLRHFEPADIQEVN